MGVFVHKSVIVQSPTKENLFKGFLLKQNITMGKATTIEDLKALMKKPINIRNICTSAHIHHGKCIKGDSRLILADGSIKTAAEIYHIAEEKGNKFEEKEEHTIYDLSQEPINILSLNKETGKLEEKKIDLAWKLQGGKTITIKLRNGFTITTTPEHKYITFENMQFVEKPAVEIKLGDNIVSSRLTETQSSINIKHEILEKLRASNFYVTLKKDCSQEIKEKIFAYGIKNVVHEIKTPLKEKSFYHGLWQNRLAIQDFLNICTLFTLPTPYDYIDTIVYRTGKQRGHNSLPMNLPQNFEEFYYLGGLFIGDGTFKRFIVGKEELRSKFMTICNNLGLNPKPKNDPGKTPAIETNKTLLYILHNLFDYPLRQKSHHVKISDFVWKSPKEYTAHLLRGYFDTDGTVELSRGAISISSASKQMIKDLGLLLLRFGIVPIIQDDTVYISGFSLLNYIKQIGFYVQHKQERAMALSQHVTGSYVSDWINLSDATRVSTQNTQKLVHLGLKEQEHTKYFNEHLVYLQVASISEGYEETVYDFTIPDNHNFVAEGIIIHNTALTDNLLAAAGLMSEKAAGNLEEGMATWQHKDEQERLMTVDAANVSMSHTFDGQDYLINLIDTPGHVDFGGNVTRAMRAIDGTIVLICGVEGIMPQTETVVRQAIRERVKPVLFINKVDRMVNELKLTPEQIQERFMKLIMDFNKLVEQVAEEEFKEAWKVNIMDGSVAFGSARENWGLSLPFMKKKGITFKQIIEQYTTNKTKEEISEWFWKNAALFEVILDMVIRHLPNPLQAQKYRIPHIWKGDLQSPFGQDLITTNPNGKPAFVITRIVIDPKFGREIAAGRLFSGTVKEGMQVWLNNAKQYQRIGQVFLYKGIKPEQIGEAVAGNVIALGGVNGYAGETVTLEPEVPFEDMKHIFEPVITKSIEPMKPQDLPKLVEILKKVSKEDPSLKVTINLETGENLIHGMGELHLEIIENRIKEERGFQVKTGEPIVVYRETILKESGEVEGKSPNKHNKFYIKVEPISPEWFQLIKDEILTAGKMKKGDSEAYLKLEKAGIAVKEAKRIRDIYNENILIDDTKGIVAIGEVQELINEGFEQVMREGPLAREPCVKIKVIVLDCKLHEDAIHRGPAQVLPAVREAIKQAMVDAKAVLYEPYQVILIECPSDFMGEINKLVSNKRGQLLDIEHKGAQIFVKSRLPVAEMIGLASDLRSATEGRGTYYLIDQEFDKVPSDLQEKTMKKIRTRKGLNPDQMNLS